MTSIVRRAVRALRPRRSSFAMLNQIDRSGEGDTNGNIFGSTVTQPAERSSARIIPQERSMLGKE
jgi:hypothetical protein